MRKTQYRILLPVKPYIRKYLHCQYGYPVQLTHNHQLGSILLSLLEKKSSSGLNVQDRRKRMKRLTATVECFATIYRMQQYGIDIPEQQIININRILEARFEEELHAYVKNNVGPHGRYPGYMEALRGFMKEYQISEEIDLPLDTLKKMEYRYRKEVAQNTKKVMAADAIRKNNH